MMTNKITESTRNKLNTRPFYATGERRESLGDLGRRLFGARWRGHLAAASGLDASYLGALAKRRGARVRADNMARLRQIEERWERRRVEALAEIDAGRAVGGAGFRRWRAAVGLSAVDAARALGVQTAAIRLVERGGVVEGLGPYPHLVAGEVTTRGVRRWVRVRWCDALAELVRAVYAARIEGHAPRLRRRRRMQGLRDTPGRRVRGRRVASDA